MPKNRAGYRMAPSLWQENPADLAVRLLAALDFEGAETAFNNWIPNAGFDPEIEKKEPAAFAAVRAAKYWGPLLSEWINTGKQLQPMDASGLDNLLIQYQNYDFGKWLKLFSQNLLQLILRLIQDLIRVQDSVLNEGENKCPKPQTKSPESSNSTNPEDQNKDQSDGNKTLTQLAAQAALLYPVISKVSALLLCGKATQKTRGQATDLLTLAFKTFRIDGRFSYLLANCYYKDRKKEQAYQQYAYSLLNFPQLTPDFNPDNDNHNDFGLPKEIRALIIKQPQPAKAVVLGSIKGVFKMIELPSDLRFSDQQHQQALDCYLAFQRAEAAAFNPNKNIRQLADARKALMEADQVLGKEYMKMIKAREER